MLTLYTKYVSGIQRRLKEAGIVKKASLEDEQAKAESVAQAMQQEDMAIPSSEDLDGAAEVIKALHALESEGSPAEAAAADDAEEAIQKVKEVMAYDGTGTVQTQPQIPTADDHLQSTNKNEEAAPGTTGSSSSVSGGEVGKETPNTPPSQNKVPHGEDHLQSTNKNETVPPGTTGSNSSVEGGEVGDDKSEKSANVSLLGSMGSNELINKLRNM